MDDLDSLLHVEQTFYDSGYTSGYAHGKIHGVIEGRALGREKGYEMWEEVAFYEGFARGWEGLVKLKEASDVGLEGGEGRKGEDRATQHIRHLLSLVSQFPSINPSNLADDSQTQPQIQTDTTNQQTQESKPDIDISKLQRQIRSRYKALCSTLGIRPRIYTASEATDSQSQENGVEDELDNLGSGNTRMRSSRTPEEVGKESTSSMTIDDSGSGAGEGETGRGERMSATGARGKGFIPVWKVDAKGERKKVTNMDLSF